MSRRPSTVERITTSLEQSHVGDDAICTGQAALHLYLATLGRESAHRLPYVKVMAPNDTLTRLGDQSPVRPWRSLKLRTPEKSGSGARELHMTPTLMARVAVGILPVHVSAAPRVGTWSSLSFDALRSEAARAGGRVQFPVTPIVDTLAMVAQKDYPFARDVAEAMESTLSDDDQQRLVPIMEQARNSYLVSIEDAVPEQR